MPARRTGKRRAIKVSAEAVARWREVGPNAMTDVCICDDRLAELLGLDALLAVPTKELAELKAALDAGGTDAD